MTSEPPGGPQGEGATTGGSTGSPVVDEADASIAAADASMMETIAMTPDREAPPDAGGTAAPEAADSGTECQTAGEVAGCEPAETDAGPGDPVATFRNPLNTAEGSDPWIVYHSGSYYLTATTWSGELTIARADSLAGLRDAPAEVVWRGDQRSRCCNFWAPEMHRLDGPNGTRWYYYFTGGGGATDLTDQRMHVLESEGDDPMGPYVYKARLVPPGSDWWAIDHSVVTIEGRLYVMFSQWDGPNQNLYIAPMQNPWTISGPRVLLSSPTHPWERQADNVNEGAVALQRDGRTFVTYSASACWGPDYKLGLLELTGDDPLRTDAWTKYPEPVFQREDSASVYGPAHNGFFKSPDGTEDWIVYHANDSAAGVCDTRRTTRAQRIDWSAGGVPALGSPLALETDIPVPSGE